MDSKNLKNIKAVVFDADGVFFTGRVFVHPKDGEILKERSHVDGQGISLLRSLGIRIAIVTGEKKDFLSKICEKLNSLPSVKSKKWAEINYFLGLQGSEKVKSVEKWLKNNKISWDECAAMGDDLSDIQILKRVYFSAAPAQAEKCIKDIVDYITERRGGDGAIRDFCNLILINKGVDQTTLELK